MSSTRDLTIPRVACAALALWVAAVAAAGGVDELFQITSQVAPREVAAGGGFELKVTFKLAEGVHLYKKQIAFQWDELQGAEQKAVSLPTGEAIKDPFALEPDATTEAYSGAVDLVVRFAATGEAGATVRIKGTVRYQGCTDTQCFLPQRHAIEHEVRIAGGEPAGATAPSTAAGAPPQAAPAASAAPPGGFVWNVLLAFVAGLLISFTPCVYPMIPITVAIVGGRGEQSKAKAVALSAVYVLGIALTYSVLGVLVAALGATVRTALQSPWLLVPIAGLFVVLALAMFDVLTIQTPGASSGLVEKMSGRSRGLFGILLLGVVSGLVAGPCVAAPLAGVLIRIAESGSKMLGFWSMFALAWGMGAILLVAGASTSLLPKAGPWMVWVKKLLGFVLLWAAAYFLKPVIGVRYYELGTAGVLLAGAVFLGGLDSLAPDGGFGERAKRFLGLVAVLAAAGLVLQGHSVRREAPSLASGDPAALEAALASGKPVMLDFSAAWCPPCDELEEKTFADPRVAGELARFRSIKLDVDKPENKPLLERFNVTGPPTIVFFDSDGTERKDLAFAGFKGPDEFLEILKQVK